MPSPPGPRNRGQVLAISSSLAGVPSGSGRLSLGERVRVRAACGETVAVRHVGLVAARCATVAPAILLPTGEGVLQDVDRVLDAKLDAIGHARPRPGTTPPPPSGRSASMPLPVLRQRQRRLGVGNRRCSVAAVFAATRNTATDTSNSTAPAWANARWRKYSRRSCRSSVANLLLERLVGRLLIERQPRAC